SGQKEVRSVSSQTEGTVTIITVGNPAYPSNVVGVRQQQQQQQQQQQVPHSNRSSQLSLTPSSRTSIANSRSLSDRFPEPLRDGVQHFCEIHMDTIRKFISSLSARIPLPAKCSIVDGRHKRYVRLNFQCGIKGTNCLYGKQFFILNTKLPKTWIHLMFLAVQIQVDVLVVRLWQVIPTRVTEVCDSIHETSPETEIVLCSILPRKKNDRRVSSTLARVFNRWIQNANTMLMDISEAIPYIRFLGYGAQDQDALLQELHGDRYFDVFEFNAPRKYWACFMCNHPKKMSELMPDGSPVIAGQLKEKKGRWKFLKRWKTRYFTLSGSQITYSKSDSM
ncbi:MELT-like protein, partial [Mya arenaria]